MYVAAVELASRFRHLVACVDRVRVGESLALVMSLCAPVSTWSDSLVHGMSCLCSLQQREESPEVPASLRVALPANTAPPPTSTKKSTSWPERGRRCAVDLPILRRRTDLRRVMFLGVKETKEEERLGTRLEDAGWDE